MVSMDSMASRPTYKELMVSMASKVSTASKASTVFKASVVSTDSKAPRLALTAYKALMACKVSMA